MCDAREKRKSNKAAARNKKAEDEKREKEEAAAAAAAQEAVAAEAAAEARKLRQVEKKAMQKQRSKLRSLSASLISSERHAPLPLCSLPSVLCADFHSVATHCTACFGTTALV